MHALHFGGGLGEEDLGTVRDPAAEALNDLERQTSRFHGDGAAGPKRVGVVIVLVAA